MIYRRLAFYDQFHCIASACTDTCCAGWEIEVDETTAASYLQEPGAFGDRLRAELAVTEDECYFQLKNNRCPFLGKDNLCDIIKTIGEDRLCDICREHPRFYNWFGNYTEVGIGLCCEEAQRLLFASDEKLTFLEEEIAEDPFEEDPETDSETALEEELSQEQEQEDRECRQMLSQREGVFFILQNRSFRMGRRLLHLMDYGLRLEEMTNPPADTRKGMETWRQLIALFAQMEALDEVWPSWMKKLELQLEDIFAHEREFDSFIADRSYEYEHFSVYLAYRYFPQSLFDGCILSKLEFIVASVLLIYLLGIQRFLETGDYTTADRDEIIRRFSKEIEYCPDNLQAFENHCSQQGKAFAEALGAMVRMVRS